MELVGHWDVLKHITMSYLSQSLFQLNCVFLQINISHCTMVMKRGREGIISEEEGCTTRRKETVASRRWLLFHCKSSFLKPAAPLKSCDKQPFPNDLENIFYCPWPSGLEIFTVMFRVSPEGLYSRTDWLVFKGATNTLLNFLATQLYLLAL